MVKVALNDEVWAILNNPMQINNKDYDYLIHFFSHPNKYLFFIVAVEDFKEKILEEYDDWRKIEDLTKNNGWIHKSLISGDRTAIIVSDNDDKIKIFNTIEGITIGNIGKGNIVSINKCKIDWCSISFNNYKGWIYKKNIWGVEDKEIINVSFFQVIIDLYWKSLNHFQKMSSVF